MKENRKAVRVDAHGRTLITNVNTKVEGAGYLKDLSISGVGFFSYEKFEVNEHIKLMFVIENKEILLEGVIVFASKSENTITRYGLEIQEISNEDYEILKEYVTEGIKVLWSEKIRKYSTSTRF